jgi:TatD DNase family protein
VLELIDSHVHLDDDAFTTDRDGVIERAANVGVGTLVIPAVDANSWSRIESICAGHRQLHPAFGLHPMFLANHAADDLVALPTWLAGHGAVAVGEIGLDFHVDGLDRQLQRHYFESQLKLAADHDLPVIVHARGAIEEVTLTMHRHSRLRGVVHSFSGSEQQAEQLWRMGFHIGIGGPVTYERAQRLRRIVATMPIEFLLLESDAPDQPDAFHRGQRNEPARIIEVLRCIAGLRGESEQVVASATTANARRLFNLDHPTR